MDPDDLEYVPDPGSWPVDPQEGIPVSKARIWVDGCFDFAHHGHAGALLQAKRLGKELYVGVHSDEAIFRNKGPTVMKLQERLLAADACRWTTKSVPNAPYITYLPWVTHYGCWYVAHGDDITSDSSGEDCYRFAKAAGRFLVFKRTPGISTTDLVGRMLLCTKHHFIRSLSKTLAGQEGPGSAEERQTMGESMLQRIKDYASDSTGLNPGLNVFIHSESDASTSSDSDRDAATSSFQEMVSGGLPSAGQRIVYVDGGFDIFSSGHIEFLKHVKQAEYELSCQTESLQRKPAFLIAGVHDDLEINRWKGLNYPIMNIFERGLCVLQCRFVDAVIFSAPFTPSKTYLSSLPFGIPDAVYHGPTSFMPLDYDPYTDAKAMGIYHTIESHDFQHVNAEEVVQRILKSKKLYEERQKRKGAKSIAESAAQLREAAEDEARSS